MSTDSSTELRSLGERMLQAIQKEPNRLVAYYANSLVITRGLAFQTVEHLRSHGLIQRSNITERLKPVFTNDDCSEPAAIPTPIVVREQRFYGELLEPVRAVLARGGEWTVKQIRDETGGEDYNVRHQLKVLMARNEVLKKKDIRCGYFCRYELSKSATPYKTKVDQLRDALRGSGILSCHDLSKITGIATHSVHGLLFPDIQHQKIRKHLIPGRGRGGMTAQFEWVQR